MLLLLGWLLATGWEQETECGVGACKCRQLAFYAMRRMRRGNTSSLIALIVLRCGHFFAQDWISTLLLCLKMDLDGLETHRLMSLWSWSLSLCSRQPCIVFGRREMFEFIIKLSDQPKPWFLRWSKPYKPAWIPCQELATLGGLIPPY